MKHSRTYLLVQASAAVDKALAEPNNKFGLTNYRAVVSYGMASGKFVLWLSDDNYCAFAVADRKELQAMLVDDWTMEQGTMPNDEGNGCSHPSQRLYAGVARDDTKPGGKVFWVGCLDCGAILTPTDKETDR